MADKTKAQEIYEQVHTLMEQGMSRSEAFDKIASDEGRPKDSIRGSYYGHKKKLEGGEAKPRTKRRETTAADALADARAALERSIASIDREVEVAEERAREYAAEAKDLKESAAARKKAISERLETLS